MISIKKVTTKDSPFILSWRNNNFSRKYSRNQKLIKKNDHDIWFKNEINNKKNILLIAYNEKNRIGFIRYNFIASQQYEISINLNPKYRNKKLGKIFIHKSEKFLKKNCLVIASVNKRNTISNKFFSKVGYTKILERNRENIYYKIHNVNNYENSIKYNKIIDKIELIRNKNNVNWMDILRLAFNTSPEKARIIFQNITSDDKEINSLSKKLSQII